MPRERYDWVVDTGVFRDSARNTAAFAGAGFVLKPTERLRVGAALVALDSETYNAGNSFIAPIPAAAYEWRALSVNMAYSPRVGGVNDVNTLLFWLTFWPKGF
jgi:hypothetical protein